MVPAACSTVLPALKWRRGARWGVGGGACYAAIRAGTPLMAPATTTAWRVGSAAVAGGPPTTPTDALRYCPARRCEGLAERRPASRLQARAHGPLRACLSTDSARAGTDLEVPRRTRRVADGMDGARTAAAGPGVAGRERRPPVSWCMRNIADVIRYLIHNGPFWPSVRDHAGQVASRTERRILARWARQHPSLSVIRSQDRRVACRLGVPQEVWTCRYRRQSLSFWSGCLINGRVVTCSCWSRSAVLI